MTRNQLHHMAEQSVCPSSCKYKLAVLIYRCLHGIAPSYLAKGLLCVADVDSRRRSRSASTSALIVPKTRLAVGDRAFYVAATRTWNNLNNLPFGLTSASSLSTFRRQLKTLLYTRSDPDSFHRTRQTVSFLCREFRLLL